MISNPGKEACRHKQTLEGELREAIARLMALHNEDFEAVVNGDFSQSESIQKRLQEARIVKTLIIEQFRNHMEQHGC